jgi:hypothetical protein
MQGYHQNFVVEYRSAVIMERLNFFMESSNYVPLKAP